MKTILATLALLFIFSCAPKNALQYSKIEYSAGACYGFCPVFKLEIASDRRATIEAESNTFTETKTRGTAETKEGTFKATLKEADYNTLVKLLNGLKLETLKDSYKNRNVSDLPSSNLNITFSNGNTKSIEDYGKNGTPELKEVYTFLENLRKTQSWTRVTR